ncbi:MAG TPA: TolC family protein [Prolixibacteraceae bacterium]|nr:TolC family protein [Prolixibacteraceae bacterium]
MKPQNRRTNERCEGSTSHGNELFSICLFRMKTMKAHVYTFYLFSYARGMNCQKALTLIVILLLGLRLPAQEKWTLNECIGYAIENNLQLQDAALDEKIAETNYRQSKWNLLPGLSAGADAGMNYGRSIDPNTNGIVNTSFFNNTYYLSASLDVFRGLMLQNQVRYQKLRKEYAGNNKVNVTDDLAFTVMNAFFNVVYYEELLKIANEQKALSELNVRKTSVLVTTGLKSQTDLLEVKANFEKEELFILQTANNLQSSWISLKKAMNLPAGKQITLLVPQEAPMVMAAPDTALTALFSEHARWSPYIRLFENNLQASKRYVNISRGGYFPSLKLGAGYNTGFYETNRDAANQVIDFNTQIDNNRSQFLGASLSIPLFGRNATRFEVKRAKLNAEQSQAKLELAKQTVMYEMEENYNELTASIKEMQQAERQLEADTLVFQAAQKKFDQGLINAVELYTIKNRLATTSSQVLHSRLTYEIKKRMVGYYRGERFWE